MDFLKVLMLYMSLTFATAVDAAPVPTETPLPTSSPTPAIVSTAVPEETEPEITVTPVPTETAVPVPTITPNAAYKTLSYGSKGADVKALQQRLSELGYLSGSIDGSYGYQTKNAVIKFQRANGLAADGVAGRATQTMLFEDPGVLPDPDRVTPSPAPTATPGTDGIVPLEADPLSVWKAADASVLLNGEELQIAQRPDSPNPGVWQRGSELMFSLDDLVSAASWSMADDSSAEKMSGVVDGVSVAAEMEQGAQVQSDPETKSVTHCENYTVTADGTAVEAAQGDLVYYNGAWYISGTLLNRITGLYVQYDPDEQAVVIRQGTQNAEG